MSNSLILAIETSCDETAVAVLEGFGEIRSSDIASQIDLHAAYGGVVPEVASRNHLQIGHVLVRRALAGANVSIRDIDAFAATLGPGLATALLIGSALAKGLAIGAGRPFLGINHIEGHLLSPFFGTTSIPEHMGLIVSGGHTLLVDVMEYGRYQILGRTLDDAAGEAFDKVAKLAGLRYPGGPEIEKTARGGNPARYAFPRAMQRSGDFQFSFSGLKTAVRYLLEREKDVSLPDLCASFQEAVLDVLVDKTLHAAHLKKRSCVGLSGGVGCNERLRQKLGDACKKEGFELRVAGRGMSTDNAAMIAFAASHAFAAGKRTPYETDVFPNFSGFESFQEKFRT